MEGFVDARLALAWDTTEAARGRYKVILDAEGDYYRSRRRAFIRALAGLLGIGAEPGVFTVEGGKAVLRLACLAGVIDGRGRPRRGVPPMGRGLVKLWIETCLEAAVGDEDWVFAVERRRGGLYLAGGGAALVRLETLRMRGAEVLVARIASEGGAGSDRLGPGEGSEAGRRIAAGVSNSCGDSCREGTQGGDLGAA